MELLLVVFVVSERPLWTDEANIKDPLTKFARMLNITKNFSLDKLFMLYCILLPLLDTLTLRLNPNGRL